MAVTNYTPVFADQLAAASLAHRTAMHAGHVWPSDSKPRTGNWHRDQRHLATLHLLLYLEYKLT